MRVSSLMFADSAAQVRQDGCVACVRGRSCTQSQVAARVSAVVLDCCADWGTWVALLRHTAYMAVIRLPECYFFA